MGVLRWIDFTVSDSSYFKLNTDHTPLHLILLDEVSNFLYDNMRFKTLQFFILLYNFFQISSNHILQHQKVLDLLVRLFERNYEELDVLEQVPCPHCIWILALLAKSL